MLTKCPALTHLLPMNASFFYPLKTSENFTVFWCFQWVANGCIGNEWVKLGPGVREKIWNLITSKQFLVLSTLTAKQKNGWKAYKIHQSVLNPVFKILLHYVRNDRTQEIQQNKEIYLPLAKSIPCNIKRDSKWNITAVIKCSSLLT